MPIEGKIPNTYKKVSQRGWYSKWYRIDVRGKSSKELKEMVKELISQRNTLLSAIQRFKYIIQKQKEAYQYKASLKQGKIRRRNVRLSDVKDELHDREKEVRKKERQIDRLLSKIDDKSGTISELEKELNKEGSFNYLLDELNKANERGDIYYQKYRRLLQRKRYKPVKKVVIEKEELNNEEKKIRRLAEKPITEKDIKIHTIIESTESFLEENDIPLRLMSCLTKLNNLSFLNKKEMNLTKTMFNKGESLGLIASEYLGVIQSRKFWYITPKGKEMVQRYIDHIHKAKSNLI